jgi:membrane protease YdiL (CAAX protease family)
LQRLIESMSPRAEFTFVILGAFGMFVLSSVTTAFSADLPPAISDEALLGLVIYELFLLVIIGTFLALRGWRGSDLGMGASLNDVGIGCLLAAGSYAGYIVAGVIYGLFLPIENDVTIDATLQPLTVGLLSLVNGFFEELFVCAYLINAVRKRRSAIFAINVSVAIRLAYHLYQGPMAVASIVPIGLIFGYWFARTGRLWPLVVAHALMDFLALWPYVE